MTSKELDTLVNNPVERIRISQNWNVRPDWIFEGYLELCQREETPTLEEIWCIIKEVAPADSYRLIFKIMTVGEAILKQRIQGCPASDAPVLVSKVFGLPLPDHYKTLNPA